MALIRTDSKYYEQIAAKLREKLGGATKYKPENMVNAIEEISSGSFGKMLDRSITDVIIPENITDLGLYAFCRCNNIRGVKIPNNIRSLSNNVFDSCSSLKWVFIPDNVSSIASYAFTKCARLTIYAVENKISWSQTWKDEKIPVVYGCVSAGVTGNFTWVQTNKGITIVDYSGNDVEIIIPNSINNVPVTSIASYAFYDCKHIVSISIPDSITAIGDYAFDRCNNLVEVINHSALNITAGSSAYGSVAYYAKEVHTGSSKIVNIDNYLFYTYNDETCLCSYIGNNTDIIFPEAYAEYKINNYAFYSRKDITSISIPDNIKSIGNYAFYDCSNILTINIGNGVTTIGDYAFCNCKNVTDVSIGNNVTNIGTYVFTNCSSLTTINIPNSIISIGSTTFSGCDNIIFNEYDNGYYLGNDTNPYLVLIKESKPYIISCTLHEDTKMLYYSAFGGCSDLVKVVIPCSIPEISSRAFYKCSSLTDINIPNSVTSIKNEAFYDCTSLENIIIPNSVDYIGESAFYRCTNLIAINIPNNVIKINNYTFYNCTALTQVDLSEHTVIPTLSSKYAFYNVPSTCQVILPDNLYDEWINATNWSALNVTYVKASEVSV